MMKAQQLELTFDPQPAATVPLRRRTPRAAVRWWFDRIHRTVADAIAQRRAQAEQREREWLARATEARRQRGLATRPPVALVR